MFDTKRETYKAWLASLEVGSTWTTAERPSIGAPALTTYKVVGVTATRWKVGIVQGQTIKNVFQVRKLDGRIVGERERISGPASSEEIEEAQRDRFVYRAARALESVRWSTLDVGRLQQVLRIVREAHDQPQEGGLKNRDLSAREALQEGLGVTREERGQKQEHKRG